MTTSWKSIGPSQLGGLAGNVLPCAGRIDGFDISSDYDGHGHAAMYLAMPGGGVWRSTDFTSATPKWTSLTDHIAGINDSRRVGINVVSTLAVDPKHPQMIYARAGGSPAALLKSTNSGDTWTLIGENQFGTASGISRVLVDPNGRVYAAFNSGGFWASTDGGTTWANVAGKALDGVEFHDAVYLFPPRKKGPRGGKDPQDTIYVGVIDRQGRDRSGVWSLANGQWTQMPMTLTNLRGQAFANNVINHITMSAEPTAGVCASLSQGDDGVKMIGLLNVFKLIQGTWEPQWFSKAVWFTTQNGYCQAVCIAPDGRLYFGGVGLGQSAGAQSFVNIHEPPDTNGNRIHTDQHVVGAYEGNIYVGNDGGLFRFTPRPDQPGVDKWEPLNTPSLSNFLSTGVTINPANSALALVGNQDNGIGNRSAGGQWTYSGFSNEREKLRFDPDPANQGQFAYSSDPANGFYWSQDGGLSFGGFQPKGVPAPNPPPPFAFHPNNSARIMIGWTTVYETPNRGKTWSKKLILQEQPTALSYAGQHAAYVGVNGQLFQTFNDGQNWGADPFDFGGGIVSICADPRNPDAIHVATRTRVFRRLNPQEAWEDLNYNLPIGINAMVLLPEGPRAAPWIFVGTDAGVYIAASVIGIGTWWVPFGTRLPDASVQDLEIAPSSRLLVAATWGRGAWSVVIPSNTSLVSSFIVSGLGNIPRKPPVAADPLWDPLRDFPIGPQEQGEIQALRDAARGIVALTELLLDPHATGPTNVGNAHRGANSERP